jgi:YHS domain-containing protein
MNMKNIAIIATLAALIVAGCSNQEGGTATNTSPAATKEGAGTTGATLTAVAYDKGSKKVGDKGACAVCTINEGKVSAEEEAKAVLDYNEKTYVFCDEAEKADFISNPKKYTGS